MGLDVRWRGPLNTFGFSTKEQKSRLPKRIESLEFNFNQLIQQELPIRSRELEVPEKTLAVSLPSSVFFLGKTGAKRLANLASNGVHMTTSEGDFHSLCQN